MTRSTSERNHTTARRKSQHIFDWPALREAIAFYEGEHLCYLPAEWGQKNLLYNGNASRLGPPPLRKKPHGFRAKARPEAMEHISQRGPEAVASSATWSLELPISRSERF